MQVQTFAAGIGGEHDAPVSASERLDGVSPFVSRQAAVQDRGVIETRGEVQQRVPIFSENQCGFGHSPQQLLNRGEF